MAVLEQRRDLALVARDEAFVGPLVHLGLLELHAVALGEALDLAVAEHGQAGQRGQQGADAEVLVAGAELVDGGALVGIAHEVDVALEDVGIELDGLLQIGAVLGVLLVAQHVHEGAVVDAMHAEGADEVAFEQPEGFGEQQRAGNFGGDAVDDLAPELVRHEGVELLLRHGVFGARGDGAAGAGQREPEALHVALGQHHGGVEADDGEEARDVQDGLDDVLADGGLGVVELRGVVPGEGGAVVAVVDVAGGAVAWWRRRKTTAASVWS
jgi:hypothetical protein